MSRIPTNRIETIKWPAIIHHDSEAELTYISNHKEWVNNADLHFHAYSAGDQLIDCSGRIFSLPNKKGDKFIDITLTDKSLKSCEFSELVKSHLSQSNQCCISKIHFRSFEDSMALLNPTVS